MENENDIPGNRQENVPEQATEQTGKRKTLQLEIQRLSSKNHPGIKDDSTTLQLTRSRVPSTAAARTAYQEALQDFNDILDCLHQPDSTGLPRPISRNNSNYQLAKDLEARLKMLQIHSYKQCPMKELVTKYTKLKVK